MLLDDPHDKGPAESGWSTDWRFRQMMMKLGRHDLASMATRLSRYRFGTDDLTLLTQEQKAQLVADCERELVSVMSNSRRKPQPPSP
jgi:hypothetical protein